MPKTAAAHSRLTSGVGLCLAVMLAVPAGADAQSTPTQLVVFGTSLSDPGNAFALVGTSATPPDFTLDPFLIPSAPYARGGHHLSNGETWVEQLARDWHLGGTAGPAFQNQNPTATNYAVADARARDVAGSFNLSAQVDAFLRDVGGIAPSDAVYVIEIGSNDIRDALSPGADAGTILGEALTAIAHSISVLYAAGARNFLVWNVPDIGLAPALTIVDSMNPGAAAATTLAIQQYNAVFFGMLAGLPTVLPGINIIPFDAFGVIREIALHPSDYGLTNTTDSCLTPLVAPFACQHPDEYLFWDGIHPTTAVHGIVADAVGALLVP
jgi:phospholipase/lecithinase/hemolysin